MKKTKGFGLVESMLVMAIMSVITVIALYSYNKAQNDYKIKEKVSQLELLAGKINTSSQNSSEYHYLDDNNSNINVNITNGNWANSDNDLVKYTINNLSANECAQITSRIINNFFIVSVNNNIVKYATNGSPDMSSVMNFCTSDNNNKITASQVKITNIHAYGEKKQIADADTTMNFDIKEVDSTPTSTTNPDDDGTGASGSGNPDDGSAGGGSDDDYQSCNGHSTKNETCGETQEYVEPPSCTSYKCQTEPSPCYSAKCNSSIRGIFEEDNLYKVSYSTEAVFNQSHGQLYEVDTSKEYTRKNTTLNNLAQSLCSNGEFQQKQANGETYYSCKNGQYKTYVIKPIEGTEQFDDKNKSKPSINEQKERMYQARKVREACVVPNSSSSYSCNASIFY